MEQEHFEKLKFKPQLNSNKSEFYDKKKVAKAFKEAEAVIRKRNEKKENYGKYVKEMYWPKASEKKANELALLKEKLHHKSPAFDVIKNRIASSSQDAKSPQGELKSKLT